MASPKILFSVVAVFALVLGACGPGGNLEKGVAAYESEDWDTAYHELSPLAEKGVPEAQHFVGLLYLIGNAVPKNQATALDYLWAAADQGYSESQYELGLRLIKGDGLNQDISEGELMLRHAFENGSIESANAMCIAFHGHESEVPKDREKSIKWCRLAAEKGGANEKGMLGYYLSLGDSLEELQEGYEWLSVSADEGEEKATDFLGDAAYRVAEKYSDELNFDESRVWCVIAADHGYPEAQADLGGRYLSGLGLPEGEKQDIYKGLRLLRTAAENGSNTARWKLRIASIEHPLLIDAAERIKCATLAMEDGYPWGFDALANHYEDGEGVPKDNAKAAELRQVAANMGLEYSQYNLGRQYVTGNGVPKDFVLAYKWFNIAASTDLRDLGRNAAEYRDEIAGWMEPYEIAEAQRLSRDWKPHDPTEIRQDDVEPESKPVSFGTGFVINQDGAVLTNHHVVEGCDSIYANGTLVEILAGDPYNDLSVLSGIRGTSFAEIRSNGFIDVGDDVIAAGFPLSDLLASSLQAVSGEMSAVAGPDNDSRFIQITAPINPGNSGGPLLDLSGNVLGVTTMTLDSLTMLEETGTVPQNVNFAIKSSVVMSFLESNDIEYEKARSWWAKDASDVVKRAREFTVLVECRE